MSTTPQMTIDDYKRMALAQAQLQPPSPAAQIPPNIAAPSSQPPQASPSVQMPNPMPNLQAQPQQVTQQPQQPQQQQQPSVTDVQPHPGPIKSFLSQFLQGAGDALKQHAGLETTAQTQQRQFQNQQASASAQRQAQLQQAQIQNFQSEANSRDAGSNLVDSASFGIPGMSGMVMQKDAIQAIKQHLANQGKQNVAQITAGQQVRVDPEFANSIGMPELGGTMVSGKTQQNLNNVARGLGINKTVGDIGGGNVGILDKSTGNVVKNLGTSARIIGAGINAQNRTVQVVNPNDPNSTIQMSPSQANRMGAQGTQSIPYQTQKGVVKDFTSGKDAGTINAINTAYNHLDLLDAAGASLKNGDIQGLNRIANQFGAQTGQSAPIVFNNVKTALTGELAKAYTSAGATVSEQENLAKSINDANSPAQLHAVVASAKSLLHGKEVNLQGQFTQGLQGKPNFSATQPNAPAAATHRYNPATGKIEAIQ